MFNQKLFNEKIKSHPEFEAYLQNINKKITTLKEELEVATLIRDAIDQELVTYIRQLIEEQKTPDYKMQKTVNNSSKKKAFDEAFMNVKMIEDQIDLLVEERHKAKNKFMEE